MSDRDTKLLLGDMLDSALKIRHYTKGLEYESFIADDKTIDAVIRNFEIIWEAANRIDSDYKTSFPEVEWKRLRGFRNRIIHDYFGIDYEIVWNIFKEDIDILIEQLEILVNSNENWGLFFFIPKPVFKISWIIELSEIKSFLNQEVVQFQNRTLMLIKLAEPVLEIYRNQLNCLRLMIRILLRINLYN